MIFFSRKNEHSNQKENQPVFLFHLLWDEIHIGLLQRVLLKEQELETCGYELTFLANLLASYLFEKSKTLLNRPTYQDI